MPRPRKQLICLAETPYYHVVSRCVRRAYLCGADNETGKSYEHRREWLEDRVRVLASTFAIELCAYAIMSNHYHLVVKICPKKVEQWGDNDVLQRWARLFKGPLVVQRYLAGDALNSAEAESLQSILRVYRSRLKSLSWFMKCLNEPIARRANLEDGCTGHFWEARFHSQALRSDQALLAAMAYVDLNPVRAGISESPETSDFTSFKARVTGDSKTMTSEPRSDSSCLLGFSDENPPDVGLPIRKSEYLKLVDYTGRTVRHGNPGKVDNNMAPILERLGIGADQWLDASTDFRRHFRNGALRLRKPA